MKYLILALVLMAGCSKGPDPIEVCRDYCTGYLDTIVRIGTERSDNLYHCRCSNSGKRNGDE